MKFLQSFNSLKTYVEQESFKGWDPYDGLNSEVFQATPLKKWDLARLVWIQGFKRSPLNFRKLLLVPKEYNAKGIGLILTGYCNIYHVQQNTNTREYGKQDEILEKINFLADLLIELQSDGYSGACWGYNFDWQARRLFLFPKNTPTVVATNFAASGLFEAYEISGNTTYLNTALSSAQFVLKDLKRTPKKKGFLFSYSPLEGNNTVYNASLLGSRLLSLCYKYDPKQEYIDVAQASIEACIEAQNENGSWVYGELPVQNWIDSFHTGYNLDGLIAYQKATGDISFENNIKIGFEFYIRNFFKDDGTPKYYHNQTYPIDIHCPAQLFVSLHRLNKSTENMELEKKVMNWTLTNMQDSKGYFYYQLKKGLSSKISYMRWSNAFMFYAMSFYLLNRSINHG
ncbi:hypothetical protein [uncultured Draconibacterium sp.]|uniref:hypothetical protein n=1 Tax=uncultured Draconibacterium sp. TaxID=1573823 RepID=UPI0032172C07